MELKDILENRRQEMGLTLAEMGKLLGVSKQTAQKYTKGVLSNPPLSMLRKMSDKLGIDPVLFFGGCPKKDEHGAEGLYKQLDERDKVEIIGEMKGMLKNDKYRKEKGSLAAG